VSGGKGARREERVDPFVSAKPLAFTHAERHPSSQSIRQREGKSGIEGGGSMHDHIGWDVSSELVVLLEIQFLLQRQDVGPPAKFGKILAELQRPQNATTAPLRGIVIGDHENVVHEHSADERLSAGPTGDEDSFAFDHRALSVG